MGMGAADSEGRLAASVGELDAVAPDFSPALDVPNAGVLWALPALLAVGLLADVERHLDRRKTVSRHDFLDITRLVTASTAITEADKFLHNESL